jgi:hypothetical protein
VCVVWGGKREGKKPSWSEACEISSPFIDLSRFRFFASALEPPPKADFLAPVGPRSTRHTGVCTLNLYIFYGEKEEMLG